MPDPRIQLYYDALEALNRAGGGTAQGLEDTDLREAVDRAQDECAKSKLWTHHQTLYRIETAAPVTNLTATYVDSTRLMTFSATPPTWIQNARIKIEGTSGSSIICDVKYYSGSGSVVTMDDVLNPQADLSSATECEIRRYQYPLPYDFKGIFEIHDENLFSWERFVTPQDILARERVTDDQFQFLWTLTPDPDRRNGYNILLYGAPTSARTVDFWYHRWPRTLKYSGFESAAKTGTVSISGKTVTGVGTSFTEDMEGSYLRLTTSTTTLPDGRYGTNPYSEQIRIRDWASTTSLELEATPTGSYSGVKFRVSDPIDLPRHLDEYFAACCLVKLGRIRNFDPGRRAYDENILKREWRRAIGDDRLFISPEPVESSYKWLLGLRPGRPLLSEASA